MRGLSKCLIRKPEEYKTTWYSKIDDNRKADKLIMMKLKVLVYQILPDFWENHRWW
jgi:hypothetical protein